VESLLLDGRVLVAGGTAQEIDTAELYDAVKGSWSRTGNLNTMRKDHAATLLPSGMVLVTGGALTHQVPLASTELYDPDILAGLRVSGRGSINGQGDQATFNFYAKQSGDHPAGSFSFNDPAAEIAITKARIRTLTFNGNTAELVGTTPLNGATNVTYHVNLSDRSSDGSTDTFSISLSNGYSARGTLTSGDIKIE
jgi:hypothetical protein